MKVHLFGAASSPGCANYGLKQAAKDGKEEYGHKASEFLKNNFYVDDGLASVPTITEAVDLIKNAKLLCAKAGLKLHKFASNSKDVLNSIDPCIQSEGAKVFCTEGNKAVIERVLGIVWNVENDSFDFRIELRDSPLTRRGVLSTICSIFDPLGYIAPVILNGKIILQRLCEKKYDWDDLIPEDIRIEWSKWRSEILSVKNIQINRCCKPQDFGETVRVEMHHFSDGSTAGYGQCSYLKQVDQNGKIACALLLGKSRVAPLRYTTVPRLELNGAALSATVSKFLTEELRQLSNINHYFWVDSQVVLGYIKNPSKRFHVFVANRVATISKLTDVKLWNFIEGTSNPSDIASRGSTVENLMRSTWFLGPEFLQSSNEYSFTKNTCYEHLEDFTKEVKHNLTALSTNVEQYLESSFNIERLSHISSWFRAKRAVANCLLYLQKLKNITPSPSMNVTLLQNAEIILIKGVQNNVYHTDIERIQCSIKKGQGKLNALNPILDQNGVLRVGGRLSKSGLPYHIRHPVILPKTGHVTEMVVRHFHNISGHMGRGISLNAIRQNGYWIIGGISSVSSIIHDCVKCRKSRRPVETPKMADLPEDRCCTEGPFTYCGMDVFGPFDIKQGRSQLKRYGLIFTCLSSRAIHLEVLPSMDTSAFINGLRRFLARRGPTKQLRCDRGTNFVGANNDLYRQLSGMNNAEIVQFLLNKDCDWIPFKFNPPKSSHMGGIWERLIRTVRNVLHPLLCEHGLQLNEDSFHTLLTEVENIVNSRPLTVASLDENGSPIPLCPNDILTMKQKVLLPPPGNFVQQDMYCRRRWRRIQYLANLFWSRWKNEFLLSQQRRQKWTKERRNLAVNDIVIVGMSDDEVRNKWKMARVTETFAGADGVVRRVKLELSTCKLNYRGVREQELTVLERPAHKLVLLVPCDSTKDL